MPRVEHQLISWNLEIPLMSEILFLLKLFFLFYLYYHSSYPIKGMDGKRNEIFIHTLHFYISIKHDLKENHICKKEELKF